MFALIYKYLYSSILVIFFALSPPSLLAADGQISIVEIQNAKRLLEAEAKRLYNTPLSVSTAIDTPSAPHAQPTATSVYIERYDFSRPNTSQRSQKSDTKWRAIIALISLICILSVVLVFIIIRLRRNNSRAVVLNIVVKDTNFNKYCFQHKLNVNQILTLGRSRSCDITLPYEQVSRVHGSIRLSERGLSIRDEGSKNGIKYKARKLQAHQFHRIHEGDCFYIATIRILLTIQR